MKWEEMEVKKIVNTKTSNRKYRNSVAVFKYRASTCEDEFLNLPSECYEFNVKQLEIMAFNAKKELDKFYKVRM